MENIIYKRIAREIFMHAFSNELASINRDIVDVQEHAVKYAPHDAYSAINKALGKLDVLRDLGLLS